MKRQFLLLCTILTIVACSKYADETFVPEPEREGAIKAFNATIDDKATARVGINADYKAIWHENDALTIIAYDATDAAATPTLTECNIDNESISQTTSSAKFVCKSPIYTTDEMYAIYPYNAAYDGAAFKGGDESERTFRLTLPVQQRNNDGYFRYPQLIGKWDQSKGMFIFNNQFTILGVTLTSSTACKLRSISVTGNNNEKMWGDAEISSADGSITFTETALTTARIDCDNIALGTTKTTIYIAIPPQNYEKGVTVNIACDKGSMSKVLKSGGFDCTQYVNTVVELPAVAVELTPSAITADVVRVTDGSVVIGWTTTADNIDYLSAPYPYQSASYANDMTLTFKASIYKSAACSSDDLIVSYAGISGASLFTKVQKPPRFIFTNLKPSTDYWVIIEDTTNGNAISAPLKVTTSAPKADINSVVTADAKVGDLILYENFNKLIYGGDLASRAAGVSRGDRSSITSIIYPEGELSDYSSASADKKFYLVDDSTEIGLFNTLDDILDDMGLIDWGWIGEASTATGGSVCARPGYVKIGTTSNRSAIVTPTLAAIPDGTAATIRVDFRACPYGGNSATVTASEKDIIVKELVGSGLESNWNVTYSSEGAGAALTLDGSYNTDWKEYSVELSNITNLSRIAIGGNAASGTTTNRFMLDDIRITVLNLASATEVRGRITAHADDGGDGVGGVIVSDGYSVVETDDDGYYTMTYNANAKFIFYTTPADREIAVDSSGYPLFFKTLSGSGIYNFTLDRKIAVQTKWHLYVMADPQTHEASGNSNKLCLSRFASNIAADLKSTVSTYGYNSATSVGGQKRAYGMVLGDVSWNSGKAHMKAMRTAMAADKTYVEWFTVPGNHDWYATDDDTSPSLDNYHSVFGPSCYSFDRGDVHIVGMNNTIASDGVAVADYGKGFTTAEFAWLKKDLAKVSTDKC
ncbi:MAG: hypothetical protein IKC42_05295, partial [Alistipes sp.]|nr:hypothetical protein [Alistipes sp.]